MCLNPTPQYIRGDTSFVRTNDVSVHVLVLLQTFDFVQVFRPGA